MYSVILRAPKTTIKAKQEDQSESCCSLRCWLLVWAYMRLVVSVLWTGVIVISTVGQLLSDNSREPPSRLWFGVFSIIAQLVEFGMIVTFITAGVKKSASLYRVYYRYCILTLIIFIIAVFLCVALDYEQGHYFAEIYLCYHIDIFPLFNEYEGLILFGICAFSSVCFEILLICLIKKAIKKYSCYNEDFTSV